MATLYRIARARRGCAPAERGRRQRPRPSSRFDFSRGSATQGIALRSERTPDANPDRIHVASEAVDSARPDGAADEDVLVAVADVEPHRWPATPGRARPRRRRRRRGGVDPVATRHSTTRSTPSSPAAPAFRPRARPNCTAGAGPRLAANHPADAAFAVERRHATRTPRREVERRRLDAGQASGFADDLQMRSEADAGAPAESRRDGAAERRGADGHAAKAVHVALSLLRARRRWPAQATASSPAAIRFRSFTISLDATIWYAPRNDDRRRDLSHPDHRRRCARAVDLTSSAAVSSTAEAGGAPAVDRRPTDSTPSQHRQSWPAPAGRATPWLGDRRLDRVPAPADAVRHDGDIGEPGHEYGGPRHTDPRDACASRRCAPKRSRSICRSAAAGRGTTHRSSSCGSAARPSRSPRHGVDPPTALRALWNVGVGLLDRVRRADPSRRSGRRCRPPARILDGTAATT